MLHEGRRQRDSSREDAAAACSLSRGGALVALCGGTSRASPAVRVRVQPAVPLGQAELILEFVAAARRSESRVHQMIMGAGKTTVVCPMLALMLGNHSTLVMQVVPMALLEFSRSVMRERFSSLLRKPVYTFSFDRFTAPSPKLLAKVVHARQASAVMLTSPTSLKSFILKFIETVHLLEHSANQDEEEYMASHNTAAALFRRLRPGQPFGGLKRTASETSVVRNAALRPQPRRRLAWPSRSSPSCRRRCSSLMRST